MVCTGEKKNPWLHPKGVRNARWVGLRFLKDLEFGKKSARMDKVNQVLNYLGRQLGPIPFESEAERR